MSGFVYEWQVGDKAYYLDKSEAKRDVFIVSSGSSRKCNYILRSKREKKWIKHKDGGLIVFQERVNLQPRGKRTIEKHDAQKAKWESERDQIKVGDWVVCDNPHDDWDEVQAKRCYEVAAIESFIDVHLLLCGLSDSVGFLAQRFRKATPAEIQAHELSLKPSIEQLRIDRDAAADSAIELLASHADLNDSAPFSACKKYHEAKSAHELAVRGSQ